jgi:hypothetical protein
LLALSTILSDFCFSPFSLLEISGVPEAGLWKMMF